MNSKKELKQIIILKKMKINIISIDNEGNCFYRSVSYFLLGSEEYHMNIRNIIIEWIENNFSLFETFFIDNEDNNINYKEKVLQEFEDIKK